MSNRVSKELQLKCYGLLIIVPSAMSVFGQWWMLSFSCHLMTSSQDFTLSREMTKTTGVCEGCIRPEAGGKLVVPNCPCPQLTSVCWVWWQLGTKPAERPCLFGWFQEPSLLLALATPHLRSGQKQAGCFKLNPHGSRWPCLPPAVAQNKCLDVF